MLKDAGVFKVEAVRLPLFSFSLLREFVAEDIFLIAEITSNHASSVTDSIAS